MFKVGDKVLLTRKYNQDKDPAWNFWFSGTMDKLVGKVGVVIEFDDDGDLGVEFEGVSKYLPPLYLPPFLLAKVSEKANTNTVEINGHVIKYSKDTVKIGCQEFTVQDVKDTLKLFDEKEHERTGGYAVETPNDYIFDFIQNFCQDHGIYWSSEAISREYLREKRDGKYCGIVIDFDLTMMKISHPNQYQLLSIKDFTERVARESDSPNIRLSNGIELYLASEEIHNDLYDVHLSKDQVKAILDGFYKQDGPQVGDTVLLKFKITEIDRDNYFHSTSDDKHVCHLTRDWVEEHMVSYFNEEER